MTGYQTLPLFCTFPSCYWLILVWSFLGADFNRRFLTARQFDPHAALKQFQEASQFRREKHILKLHDIVEISDFEQARQFVRPRVSCPKQG